MSKVYDKPDRSVAILWQCENPIFDELAYVAFRDGTISPAGEYRMDKPYEPSYHGRWRPYIPNNPEPWPPRKLMPRRCWATYQGERRLYVWIPGVPGQNTFLAVSPKSSECWWKGEGELSNIHYIDPEQEAVEVTQ